MIYKKISCPNISCDFIGNQTAPELDDESIRRKCPECGMRFIVSRCENSDGYDGLYINISSLKLPSKEIQTSTAREKPEENNYKATKGAIEAALKIKFTMGSVCQYCGHLYDIRRLLIGFNSCIECGNTIAKHESRYIDEPLGTREDFKRMSGRAWSNSKKDKIT